MTACPCCHSQDSTLLHGGVSDRLFRTTDKKFDLRLCRNCGVIFLFPTPLQADLEAYYPVGYWWQTAEVLRQGSWHKLLETYRRVMTESQVRRIRRLAANSAGSIARFLDIGCGDGLFLAACERLPLAKLGLDQSLDALLAARQRVGSRFVQGSAKALPFADESFGLITLFHVLEHAPAPGPCLQEARRVLRPGGWLVVQVPNAGSLQRRLLGQRWEGFDVPRHLVDYSERTLSRVLEQHGFAVERVDHFCLRDNPAMLARSFFPRLYPPSRRVGPPSQGKTRPRVNSLLDLVYLALVVLALPFALLESALGHGATIVIEASKL